MGVDGTGPEGEDGARQQGALRLTRRQALELAASLPLSIAAALALPGRALAAGPLYKDPAVPLAERVADLLSRMTLDEKVAQMIALWATKAEVMDDMTFNPAKATAAYPDGVGSMTRASDKRGVPGISSASGGGRERWRTARETVEFVNATQRWALQQTRLGIPVLFHEESLHGYMATDATMFPQAIALAGSFDTELVREVSSQIAREVRARGVPLVLSPVVDIVRDPRWGRIEETFGEDPYLVSELGVAAVEGLQGAGKFETLAADKVFATLKHMTGHGQPESGNNVGPAPLSERELRANFFPPFRSIVQRTAIASVMPSYNEIDGVPSHANRWLLDEVLREEWGFDGVIVSDYNGVAELERLHHVAADLPEAARQALAAGVDVEFPDGETYRGLAQQVRDGLLDEAAIDRAVARILELKFRAGLFESPYGDWRLAEDITGNEQARALALKAARGCLCLLSNDGTLPLATDRHPKVAVIGPNAAIARLGGYSSVPRQTVSLLEGLQTLVGEQVELIHAQGVFITQSEDRSAHEILLADPERNRELIAEAVTAARDASVIILAIGDTEQTSREGFATNHLGDRTRLDLVGEQIELFNALHALGKTIVVCAINGRPPSWPSVVARANAVLECWYAGQEGGTAIAEALFGRINPGAKLPVSVLQHEGYIPYFYNHKPSARRGYLFADSKPLFPFGHGLSYTSFELSAPRLSASRIRAGESVTVEVDVRNSGARAGDEVVQVYLRDLLASVAQPVKLLKGFQRVYLEPGEQRSVRIVLGPEAFRIWNAEMMEVIEPGTFEIMSGPDSVQLQTTELEIV